MYDRVLKEIELKEEYKKRMFDITILYELTRSKEHRLTIHIDEIMDKKTGRSEKVSEFNATEYLQYPSIYSEKEYKSDTAMENIKSAIKSVIQQVVDSDIHKDEEIKMLEQLEKEW